MDEEKGFKCTNWHGMRAGNCLYHGGVRIIQYYKTLDLTLSTRNLIQPSVQKPHVGREPTLCSRIAEVPRREVAGSDGPPHERVAFPLGSSTCSPSGGKQLGKVGSAPLVCEPRTPYWVTDVTSPPR